MYYLLDTHILLWALSDEDNAGNRLPDSIAAILENPDNTIFFSIVNIFEIELKRIVRPSDNLPSGKELLSFCKDAGFSMLSLKTDHIFAMNTLKKGANVQDHKDPYDWLLVSQAKVENMGFLTIDSKLLQYEEECIIKQ